MDELLALMDDEAPAGSPANGGDRPSSPAGSDPMGEFASLLGDEKPSSSSTTPVDQHISSPITSRSSRPVATVGVDEKLGIRMSNRNMSSLDLLDLITTSPYHSPAKVSAMSLQALCGVLVDPPSIVDRATVQGRTNMVTVGIVFDNSGTKTSSKGGAFCILTMGSNLVSGPCISVFLFGTAYTKYCRSCKAGQVVAICNPKLLPPRDNGGKGGRYDNSVSLSGHDHTQVIPVAKARDYGVCQATVGRKQANGSWKSNAGTCRNYIDKRQGDHCPFHAKQQKAKQKIKHMASCSNMRGAGEATSRNSNNRGRNLVQQHKASKTVAAQDPRAGHMASNGNPYLAQIKATGEKNIVTPPNPRNMSMPSSNRYFDQSSLSSSSNTRTQPKQDANPGTGFALKLPKHMKEEKQRIPASQQPTQSKNLTNPYVAANRGNKPFPSNQANETGSRKEMKTTMASGNWMQEAISSKRSQVASSLKKYIGQGSARKISTVGGGFDGSVPIPKPKVFSAQAPRIFRGDSSLEEKQMQDEKERSELLEKQSLLAKKLNEQKSGRDTAVRKSAASSKYVKGMKQPFATGNVFLDSIHVDDVEAVLNAKSKFAAEADAEDYAKNRRRVVELEHLETKQSKRKDAKRDKQNQKIDTRWICKTCANTPTFSYRPQQCTGSGHAVAKIRVIKEGKTKSDERTHLHEKGSKDGGLTLGEGLEWSRNMFNNII